MAWTDGGLEERYVVMRRDWKPPHPGARYIVLNYGCDEHGTRFDPHACDALLRYAECVEDDSPELAADIRDAVETPELGIVQHL